ncbi:hypothetical protein [Streptomyces sp. 147326]|uniref:hypothetical protein n=1 Tax=Streptomyces sp. 147326 TaxID=3074379 RepID=UPI003857D5B8
MELRQDTPVPVAAYCAPRIEVEVGFVLGADLPGEGCTEADVLAATERVVPALELIDSRIADWRISLADTIADNASSAGYVIGEGLLLVAGGSGITPLLSLAKSALAAGRGRVALVYANRDPASVIFRDELWGLAEAHPGRLAVVHWLESLQGLPTAAQLGPLVAPYAGREAYLCGPGR